MFSLTSNIKEGDEGISLVGMKRLQEQLNISYSTLYRWMQRGLPYNKPKGGRKVSFNIEKVERWLEEQTI